MSIILLTENLSKSFLLSGKPRLILDGVDFQMESGQFVSVVGASGCGKSTFLELLAGITVPDAGEIYFREQPITGKRGYLGYMPQDDLLFPWLDVVENVLLPVRVQGGNIKSARKRVTELLPVFGLQEHASHLPYQLSGGLRQRTAFLRTYMTGAELLLLDEPFASLDAITRMQLQKWLEVIAIDLKLSIILVTHDINEAIHLSDVVHVMKSQPGKFVASFVIDPLKSNETALSKEILEMVKTGTA